ncbi:adenine phosphoribosyltransferase [Entomoplasma ellychniae]|uniref:Adenine phosphoribosyltransferase n=2 Tax=Entomoplasmataceae TaxID=33925 RepID=A0A2S5RGH2_9MOLU|nr:MULTISPECIES: adenine phosphoribosyltransferase [Entomoplasmataceae]PPE05066.1 adenine phosphoribosyltransferase [Entomoplasma ellychniae]PPE06400.1 adenine phosphoribosyltransferase [Mesoplasma corruscae]
MNLKDYILNVENFPIDGVGFKDVTPLLNDAKAFEFAINQMAEFVIKTKADVIVAPEARGFLFASAVAYATKKRFVLIRKPGKLPRQVISVKYDLEYGTNILELHKNDIKPSDKVVIVDDVLATGGTTEAIIELVEKEQGIIAGISFLIDLESLHQKELFKQYPLQKILKY